MKEGRNSNFHMNDSFEQQVSTCVLPVNTQPSENTLEHMNSQLEADSCVGTQAWDDEWRFDSRSYTGR
jgi:hypothetical protein